MKNNFTYRKSKLSKWLLAIVLFFGSLSFSGYAGNPPSTHQEEKSTTTPFSKNPKALKRSVSYKRALAFLFREKAKANSLKNKTFALSEKRRLIKIKFALINLQSQSFKVPGRFVCSKTIPPSSDDYFLSSLAG